ncbi:Uncharacterised protein [Halioglobus japonicus]|nr:Uncharacterised protein [Halioglobus japonicus]
MAGYRPWSLKSSIVRSYQVSRKLGACHSGLSEDLNDTGQGSVWTGAHIHRFGG